MVTLHVFDWWRPASNYIKRVFQVFKKCFSSDSRSGRSSGFLHEVRVMMRLVVVSCLLAALLCLGLQESQAQSCYGYRRTVYTCGQRCLCLFNKLTNCVRIRKEFTSMSLWERERYIGVIKTASTDPKYKAEYDQLITLHQSLFLTGIHEQRHFLTWHRWYVLQYENLLRKIDCRVTVAYWDWSLVAANPWGTTSSDVWHAGKSGYGGNGVAPFGCVKTGPFRQVEWNVVPSAGGGCLRRRFNGNTPDAVAVEEILRIPASDFNRFEVGLRINLHDNVHCRIDGTMCSLDSAAAPEFFLHHGFVDKIWADWQKKSDEHKTAFFPSINELVIGTPYQPKELIDLSAQPGQVKVEYRNHFNYYRVHGYLAGQSMTQLKAIPRMGFQGISKRAEELYKTKPEDMKMAKKIAESIAPKTKMMSFSPQGARGMTKQLGFNMQLDSAP